MICDLTELLGNLLPPRGLQVAVRSLTGRILVDLLRNLAQIGLALVEDRILRGRSQKIWAICVTSRISFQKY